MQRCVGSYRTAIQWATTHGYRHDAAALREEARRIVGPDEELPQPGPPS
ncbi:MAG: hypothetical protein ACK6CT_09290 [Planctomycetia bacterium]|jgi:hypothetical protein